MRRKKAKELAPTSSICPAAGATSHGSDVEELQHEIATLRADNEMLEQRALQASADAASASQNAAEVRKKLAASIGETAAASEALAELQMQLAQRDLEIAEHGILIMQKDKAHAMAVTEIATIRREAATNKAAVAKGLELLAVRDAELAEARHQVFVSQRSTHSKKEISQPSQRAPTVVVDRSSELAAKDAVIAKLELTLAKQEALLPAAKENSFDATSQAAVGTVKPPHQPAKAKVEKAATAQAKKVQTAKGPAAANTLEASALRPDVAVPDASCVAQVASKAPDADWSIFD